MFTSANAKEIKDAIARFQQGQKPLLSNYYGLSNEDSYEFSDDGVNFVILKTERYYKRLYLITKDYNKCSDFLSCLPPCNYVINIPSKKSIEEWTRLLNDSGFKLYSVYKRFFNTKIKARKSGLGEYAQIEDIEGIRILIEENFTPETDYNPSMEELMLMVKNNQIIVTRDENNEVVGFLIYSIKGAKGYLNMWYDRSGNGLFLLYKVYTLLFEKGIKYCYFWVNSTNTKVIKLHELMGSRFDGLTDYTFIKKST